MELKIAGLTHCSVVDGPGLRSVLFTQGCPHNCPGCHNPQTHDFSGGRRMDVPGLAALLCRQKSLRGVTFSGGEPFMQAEPLAALAAILKSRGLHLLIYSGYRYEELQLMAQAQKSVASLLMCCDLLIDGPFLLEERDLSLPYRGSRNQRIIDLPATNKSHSVVLSPLHTAGREKTHA